MTIRNLLITFKGKKQKNEISGFTLAIVVVTGLIITVSTMSLAARSLNHLLNSTRQHQKREAREIAENGITLILKELNDNFSYLLIESCRVENNTRSQQTENPQCAGWKDDSNSTGGVTGTFEARGTLCPNAVTPSNLIMQELYKEAPSKKGKYRLMDYSFIGDRHQGGWATIKVQGQRHTKDSGVTKIAASAIIQKEVTIAPKYCNLPPFVEASNTGGYGLLANDVNLGTGDVLDVIQDPKQDPSQANVHCITCTEPDPDKSIAWEGVQNNTNSSIIDGERSSGPLEIPSAPEWDNAKWGNKQAWNLIGGAQSNIRIAHNSNSQYCHTEQMTPPITHCRINNITFSGGNNIQFLPEEGDIRLYVEGQQINLSGNSIVDAGSLSFGQVAIFGSAGWPWNCSSRSVNISGNGTLGTLLLHMPCWDVNLSGNVQITGSAIVKNWNTSGNKNALIVPPDASQIMEEKYNISFSKGDDVREFAAIGTNRWNLIQIGE